MEQPNKYTPGLVSIIMPTYKRCDMLLRAVNSVFSQTYKDIELIVVNDNGTEDPFNKVLKQKLSDIVDERFILIDQGKHTNGAVARNIGIRKARGEYIAFLDDDDYWQPAKIERQVAELSKLDSSWGAVSCLKLYYLNGELKKASLPYKDGYIFEDILNFLTNVTTGTILMRHAALDECGYFDETLLRQQDIQLFACFSYRYKIKLLREYLLNIDISDGQNRPNINTLWVVKKAYINSVDSILRQLPQKQQKQLQFHIKTEVGIQMLRRGRPWDGIKAVTSCLKSPRVFFLEVRKNVMLLAEILLKNCNYKKYSG